MGAEPFLIASTVNVVMAQRLGAENYVPIAGKHSALDAELLKSLGEEVDLDRLLDMAAKNNLIDAELAAAKDWSKINFYRAAGCERAARKDTKDGSEFLK